MGLRIQNNVEAFNAHRNLVGTSAALGKSMERLSSGYRINRAADDAAGLAISEKLRAQSSGLAQSQRNVGDAISMVQTAEGSLTEVHSMLQRVRELAVQYNNGTLSTTDKAAVQKEVDQLTAEMGRVQSTAQFNGIKLLDGSAGAAGVVNFQVGANDGEQISATFSDLNTALGTVVSGFTLAGTGTDMSQIDTAIQNVSDLRASFGAVQNRLEHTANSVSTYQENLVASESRIRDVDMAQEMVQLTKYQVLQQAGTAMLAQANQSSQGVLSLLR